MSSDADKLADILNLCESNPDAGLAFVEETIRKTPGAASDPFGYFATAVAYGSKGLFHLARSNAGLDYADFDERELRNDLGLTDTHLNYLERGLQSIREMEKADSRALETFGKQAQLKVDSMALVLERCRPGRVQEILGKTKLLYFGTERVGISGSCQITKVEFARFRQVFFACARIAKSANLALDGKDSSGRRYVSVMLKTSPDMYSSLSKEFPAAGFLCLYTDGTYTPDAVPR